MRNTFGSLRAWLHDNPLIPDAVFAMALAAVAVPCAYVPSLFGDPSRAEAPDVLSLALIVAGCLSLTLRRRWPFLMLCLVVVIEMTLASTGQQRLPALARRTGRWSTRSPPTAAWRSAWARWR